MRFESLKYDVRNGLAIITLNRPEKRNALDLSMRDELSQVVLQIRNDTSLYAVIITGAGGAFCAGGDIQGMAQGKRTPFESRKRIQDIYSWLYEWVSLELPDRGGGRRHDGRVVRKDDPVAGQIALGIRRWAPGKDQFVRKRLNFQVAHIFRRHHILRRTRYG